MTSKQVKRSIGKKLLFFFILLLFSLVSVELLCRGWMLIAGRPQRPSEIRKEIAELKSAITQQVPMPETALDEDNSGPGKMLLHPFWGYEILGGLNQVAQLLEHFQNPGTADEVWVLVTGGSVAQRFTAFSWDAFSQRLAQDPRFEGVKLHLFNTARGGYKQPQQSAILSFLFSIGLKPKVVINIDGFNEVALGQECIDLGVFPAYPPPQRWGFLASSGINSLEMIDLLIALRNCQKSVGAIADFAVKSGCHYSGFLSQLCIVRLKMLRTQYVNAYQKCMVQFESSFDSKNDSALVGPNWQVDEDRAMKLIIQTWFEGSLSIKAMCDVRYIPYIHILQPTLKYEGSKPIAPEEEGLEIKPSWLEGVEKGYPLLRLAGEQLIKNKVHFYDRSMLFKEVTEKIYYDCCHFEGLGNILFGKAVAEDLLDCMDKEAKVDETSEDETQ